MSLKMLIFEEEALQSMFEHGLDALLMDKTGYVIVQGLSSMSNWE